MKRRSFFLFLVGEIEFEAGIEDGARLLNLFMEYGIVYRGFEAIDGERIRFRLSSISSVMLTRLCRKRKISIKKVESRGIPPILYKHRKRVGLLIGAVIAAILLCVYDGYIWDITVSGNESVTYSEVVAALEDKGLAIGTAISGLNVDRIKTAVMVDEERISWMAINVVGTVAHVQIRERTDPKAETPTMPANIVASCDGVIERVEVFRGSATVISGQAVSRGDILISGIRDLKTGGFSVTRAAGSVFAVTEHSFRVEVPYSYTQKNYEKAKNSEISIIFFGKEIKVLKINGNKGEFCDTIDRVDMLSMPKGARLPVGIKKSVDLAYTLTESRYDEKEAMEIAYYRLERMIASALPDAELLKKQIEVEQNEDAYILICTVKCIENIAETVEFEADLK